MKKRWGIYLFLIAILASFAYPETLYGTISGVPYGETVKVSILNNDPNCEGKCSTTVDLADSFYEVDLEYKLNDTLTIYVEYEDVLNTNTEVVSKIPYDLRLKVCDPPSKPLLYEFDEIHSTTAELLWLSEDSEYTVISFDNGNFLEEESPYLVNNLDSGTHTWRVKACGNGCCSKESESTFLVSNEAPQAPILDVEGDSLVINAGEDNDTDITYVEYKINDGEPIRSNVFDIGNIILSARTCDQFSCSGWVERNINTCGAGESASYTDTGSTSNTSEFYSEIKNLLSAKVDMSLEQDVSCVKQVSTAFDGLKEIMSSKANEVESFIVNTNVPSTVKLGDDIFIDIDFSSDDPHENITFQVDSKLDFSSKNYAYLADGERIKLRLDANTRGVDAGYYDVIILIKDFQNTLYTKQFKVEVMYTMSDFEYKLNEMRIQSGGFFDMFSSMLVIGSFVFVVVVLFMYMRLKQKYSLELIKEAKLEKDKKMAFDMLHQEQKMNDLVDDTNKISPVKPVSQEEFKQVVEEAKKKTDLEKHTDELEKKRDSYLGR